MQKDTLHQAEQYTKQHRRRHIWQKVVGGLACVVVFITTYMLILPAITMEEKAYCGIEEHKHGEECYEKQLVCGYDTVAETAHIHTAACYEKQQVLVCDQEETAGHVHGDDCVQSDRVLICDKDTEGHEHTSECYRTTEKYICGLNEGEDGHVHDESCIQFEQTLICDKDTEGHTHTDECYGIKETYVCGLTEGEGSHTHGSECYGTQDVLVCGQTEDTAVHTHTDECYKEVLVCGKEEHEHQLICFSDSSADVESESVWINSISGVTLTGSWPEDVLAIAATQLGYQESSRNYTVDENGNKKGYSRYGDWYGDPYGDWCAMFVSFCMNYAEIPGEALATEASCSQWIQKLLAQDFYASRDYEPYPGDIIFFDWDGDNSADHVGLVKETTEEYIRTIEGNSGNEVRTCSYVRGDSDILGYGLLTAAWEKWNTPQLTEQTFEAVIYTDESYEAVSDDATIITVTGILPEDARICAFPTTVETDQQLLCAYDIAIVLTDGSFYEPKEGESLTVSIQGQNLNGDELEEDLQMKVYYVPEEGEPEPIDTNTTENGVSFDTGHFSVYAVLAVDATEVSSAAELKAAIKKGDSNIQLTADFSASEALTIPANANITLDLNGHTLTASGALFTIPSGTALTIIDSKQGTETVETASGSLAGNTASLSGNMLTYYVTTTSVTNSATGATQETLEKHTVSSAGAFVGGSQPVFQVTGGTLNIQSGMIRGGTGRAIVQTGGTTNLSGGYICGFTQSSSETDNTSFGGAIKASGGALNLSGTVLAGNTAHNGGAVYATGSTELSITGGVISGNTSNRTTSGWNDHSESGAYRCGGGGIYADENAEITMSGGYITNNKATHDGYFDGGGGVCLSDTSSMALSGGYVTGNQAQGGGGIRTDFGKETIFVMTGGSVSANVATHAEGGGIAIDRNGVGTVTGGYITNNKIPNTGHWGGGGLFCADGSTLNLKNTLITNNTAGGFGAGVAGCPTGNLYLYVTQGCAIYDNTDTVDGDNPHFTSDGVKQIDKEICTEVFQSNGHSDYFCALNSTVTGTMLGNNAANWQGSADYQPVIADAEDVLTATRVMGLTANPTDVAKSAAQSAAKVYINGNYSYTHGGGIMCNGNLVIGVPVDVEVPARIELQATKTLVDGSGNAQPLEENNFSFKVTMTDLDGTVVASGVCDSNGKITFDHQLTFKQAGTFIYYVYEEVDEENLSVTYDSTLYRLTMTVAKDNGVAWYGDTIKYTYSVTSVKVESSTDGETWKQVSQSDTSQSGIISLPLTSGTTFTNRLIEPTKVTVQKKWEGGSGTDSVTVILKQDGKEFDTKTLNAGNNWTYTWDDLEQGYSYTVEEVPVDGYTASYEIITSTDDSGSTSLGQGSWWVPATELTARQQYLIVSPDGTKALHVASGGEGDGFNTADVTSVTQQQTVLTINGQTYSTWYQAADIPARSIYSAEALTRNSHSGIVLKRLDAGDYPYLRLESKNNNYLKGGSTTDYASFMVFDGTYLKGHNASEWTPDNLRTVIYADGKFNTTTEQNPANAAKLYTLVSGEGFTGKTTDSTTVVITNIKEVTQDYELPETGGTGTLPYTMAGTALICGAAYLLYRNRKRGKEEL